MSSAFNAHVKSYDEKGYAKEIDIFLWEPNDKRKANEVMAATGIPTELDAVIMVFRRYQPDFLKWWSGDKSAAPAPLLKEETKNELWESSVMNEVIHNPSLNGLTEQYGENLERMKRHEKLILLATISTHFACMYTGYVLDKGNLKEAYWENSILFHIADWTPTPIRQHFEELGKLSEDSLLKLCEFLVTDLIATWEAPVS